MRNNVAVAQSGGPSAAINASLYGVIKGAWANKADKVYGARHGIEGLIKGDLVDLNYMKDSDEFERLKYTPASFLYSCRHKLSEQDMDDYEKIFANFEKYDIGCFFYIGGNDSMDTVSKLCRYAAEISYDIKIIGVPKTVDNDLVLTDHTPGYGSAAKYIGTSIREIMLDAMVYAKPSVTVVELMGRHAGWLTAAAALAKNCGENHDDMMIYLPESPFVMDSFISDVKRRISKTTKVLVAVSEGLRFDSGRFVCEGDTERVKDSFGHSTLSGCGKVIEDAIKDNLGIRTRCVEFSVLQRAAGHFSSLTDLNESARGGEAAVEYAMQGRSGFMVSFKRAEGEYAVTMQPEDVHEICNKEKFFPTEWMTDDHFVTDDYFRYAVPIITGEPEHVYENGLPKYAVLKK